MELTNVGLTGQTLTTRLEAIADADATVLAQRTAPDGMQAVTRSSG